MRHKTSSGHYIGEEFPEQFKKTLLLTLAIRRLNESDIDLTPKEQSEAIKKLSGMASYKLESIIPLSGPTLSDTIRKMISKNRAVNRTVKDRSRSKTKKKKNSR